MAKPDNDNNTYSTFAMELQVPHCVCTKIQDSILRGEADRDPEDSAAVIPMERSRDNRRTIMSGSYTPVGKHPAKDKCKQLHGISEREKQSDDISNIWKHEVCI